MIYRSLYCLWAARALKFCLLAGFFSWTLLFQVIVASAEGWKRHAIDNSSRGADGVRGQDVNGDGLIDFCTAWEEGGVVRVYLHPGHDKVKQKWPAVTVGEVASGEDAVFCDLDSDGNIDVVSCCEGKIRNIYFHWAPKSKGTLLDPSAWKTDAVPAADGEQMWMFCSPMQVDGKRGIDLVVGSKMKGGAIGWLESPENPRDMAAWKFHKLSPAGWIMSIETLDMDGDGDLDILVSDRQKKDKGVRWLENPGVTGVAAGAVWKNHFLGARNFNVKFLDVADWDGDGSNDVLASTRNKRFVYLNSEGGKKENWAQHEIENPNGVPWGKSIRAADVNLDGRLDVVYVMNTQAKPSQPGAVWMEVDDLSNAEGKIVIHDISGLEGVKFDLVQMVDLDGDGDLDLLTCEERDNLGVIWYENPTR